MRYTHSLCTPATYPTPECFHRRITRARVRGAGDVVGILAAVRDAVEHVDRHACPIVTCDEILIETESGLNSPTNSQPNHRTHTIQSRLMTRIVLIAMLNTGMTGTRGTLKETKYLNIKYLFFAIIINFLKTPTGLWVKKIKYVNSSNKCTGYK